MLSCIKLGKTVSPVLLDIYLSLKRMRPRISFRIILFPTWRFIKKRHGRARDRHFHITFSQASCFEENDMDEGKLNGIRVCWTGCFSVLRLTAPVV